MAENLTSSPNNGNTLVVGIPNRSIKFRAWHDEFGEMVYTSKNYEYGKREFTPFLFEVGFSHYPESEWQIMQFTGFVDCDGEEIYEGDILCWKEYEGTKHQTRFVITWNEQRGAWSDYSPREQAKKIGNVFQNPELLG